MSEINVTPFVDVTLVLLIIFMVAAPLLATGVPLDLPQVSGKALPSTKRDPLSVSIRKNGEVFIGDAKIELDDLADKLKAIATARGQLGDDPVFVRGDRSVDYGTIMGVMTRLSLAGFTKLSLVTEAESKNK